MVVSPNLTPFRPLYCILVKDMGDPWNQRFLEGIHMDGVPELTHDPRQMCLYGSLNEALEIIRYIPERYHQKYAIQTCRLDFSCQSSHETLISIEYKPKETLWQKVWRHLLA